MWFVETSDVLFLNIVLEIIYSAQFQQCLKKTEIIHIIPMFHHNPVHTRYYRQTPFE